MRAYEYHIVKIIVKHIYITRDEIDFWLAFADTVADSAALFASVVGLIASHGLYHANRDQAL